MEAQSVIPQETTTTIMAKVLEIVKPYEENEDMSEIDFSRMILSIYETIDAKIAEYLKNKEQEFTAEDLSDLAGFAIESADFYITTFLRRYSLDSTDAPYRTSSEKIHRVISIYSKKIMKGNDSIVNELCSLVFTTLFIPAFLKAKHHRETVKSTKK